MLPPSAAVLSMRIAKRIARSGVCSRREAERLIENGRVSLNGTFSGNSSLWMATSKQSPKSMWTLTSQRKTQSESITNHFPLYSELALSLPTNSTESLSQRWIVKVVDSCRFSLDRRTIFDRLKKTGLECHIMPVVCGSVCVLDRDNWTSIQRGCCC